MTMKAEEESINTEVGQPTSQPPPTIEGDVIGKTAYSQRFVLKLLLKIANLETLQEAITNDESFEENLCVLWDMSSDKDVVMYLQEHNTLKLIQFALPSINKGRISEILIGIVANMCCYEEIVREIMKMDTLLNTILGLLKLFDTGILTQGFRFIDVCVFRSSKSDIDIWLSLFNLIDYSEILYFTLKNSSNSELLARALENLNTVSAKCNDECYKTNFYLEFVKPEAIDSLLSAFTEITIKQKGVIGDDMIERLCNITIQIIIYLLSMPFNKSYEIFENTKDEMAMIISVILIFYKDKFLDDKIVTSDLDVIGQAVFFIVKKMRLYEVTYEKIVVQIYEFWNIFNQVLKSEEDFKTRESWEMSLEEEREDIENINLFFSKTICCYLEKCTEDNLQKVMDLLVKDLDDLLDATKDESIKDIITQRTSSYVSLLSENIDS